MENTLLSKRSVLAFDARGFLLLLSQPLQMPNVSTERLSEGIFVIVPDTKLLTRVAQWELSVDSRSDSHQGTGDEWSDDSGRLKKGKQSAQEAKLHDFMTNNIHEKISPC